MVSRKRYQAPARRTRRKLRKRVQTLRQLWLASKVPTDAPDDGDEMPNGTELRGVDGRGCQVVALLVILISCGALASVHLFVSILH